MYISIALNIKLFEFVLFVGPAVVAFVSDGKLSGARGSQITLPNLTKI